MGGHVVDSIIWVLTALMCWWSVRTYVIETRGSDTRAKAAAKRYERRHRIERWREEPTLDNLCACLYVKVDPEVYRMF